jgi:hypothetical protein
MSTRVAIIRRAMPIRRFKGAVSLIGAWQAFFCHD